MAKVSVIWSAVLHPDSDGIMARREETLMPLWADMASNANEVAADVLRHWCDLDRWDEWFGLDAGDGECAVIIHAPASIRGRYRVNLELVTKARAEPLTAKESKRLDFMLENETDVQC